LLFIIYPDAVGLFVFAVQQLGKGNVPLVAQQFDHK
jgi:hypothetical protein